MRFQRDYLSAAESLAAACQVSAVKCSRPPAAAVCWAADDRRGRSRELQVAAAGEPSKYSALGGVGPRNSGETIVTIHAPASDYDLSGDTRIIGVNGTHTITGHGDISNEATTPS